MRWQTFLRTCNLSSEKPATETKGATDGSDAVRTCNLSSEKPAAETLSTWPMRHLPIFCNLSSEKPATETGLSREFLER